MGSIRTIRRPTTCLPNVSPLQAPALRSLLMHPSNKKSLAVAALVACALGATTVVGAAEPKSKKTEEQQIEALQKSLLTVQKQLQQLADQNQVLMQHQQQLEQQLQQQQAAVQKVQADAANAVAAAAAGQGRPGATGTPGRSA